jgi:F420-dependent oxidoreductase-like protein
MKLSTQLAYGIGGPQEQADLIASLEPAGLDLVWVAEAYTFDAPTMMGYLAARTERVEIGAGILPLYSRTPTLTAMTAAGLDAVSNGRAVLGLGASGPQVIEGWHGVPYDKPLARTREIIEICRQVWRRERLVHDGACYQVPLPEGQGSGLGKPLKLINRPVRERIPIWVASLGDRNVELTAELAEGWLPLLFVPELADKVWAGALKKGSARRADDLGPLQISAGGFLAIGEPDDVAWVRDLARPMVALYVGGMGAKGRNFYNDVARRYGFEAEAEAVQDAYLDGRKDEAAKLLPDALVDSMVIAGPEGHVRERISAYREAGVTHLNVIPVGADPVKLIEQVKSWMS